MTLKLLPDLMTMERALLMAFTGLTVYMNDTKVAERAIVYANARYIAPYKDGVDVGADLNSPVSDRYQFHSVSRESSTPLPLNINNIL